MATTVSSTVLEIVLRGKNLTDKAFKEVTKGLSGLQSAGLPGISALTRATAALAPVLRTVGGALQLTFFEIPKRVLGTFIDLVKTATLTVGGLTAALGTLSVKLAVDVERGIAKLQTASGFAETTPEELRRRILAISAATGLTVAAVSAAAFEVGSALAENAEALEITELVAKTSVGTFSDFDSIVKGLATSMNAFGASSDKATAFLNVLNAAQDKGKTDFAGLAAAMGQVAAQAREVGLSFEQTAGLVGFLSLQTNSANEAATQLGALLTALQRNAPDLGRLFRLELISEDPVRFFEELGRAAEKSGKSLVELLGRSEAAAAVASVLGNVDKLRDALDAVESPARTVLELFADASETTGVKFAKLTETVKGTLATIGTELLPTVDRGLDAITRLFTGSERQIADFARLLGFAASEAVTLIEELARTIRSSKLFEEGPMEAVRRIALATAGLLTQTVGHVLPALTKTFFEIGATVGLSLVQGLKDVFRTPVPIEEAIRSAEEQLREITSKLGTSPATGPGVLFQEQLQKQFDEIRERIRNLIFLRDELGQQDDRLIGSTDQFRRTQESLESVLTAVGGAFKAVGTEAAETGRAFLGDESFTKLGEAATAAGERIGSFAEKQKLARDETEKLNQALELFGRIETAVPSPAPRGKTDTGDPAKTIPGQVEDKELKTRFEKAFASVKELSRRVADSVGGAFDDAFERIVDGTFRVQDAFRALGVDILRSFERTIASLLSNQLFTALFGTVAQGGAGLESAGLFSRIFQFFGGGASAASGAVFRGGFDAFQGGGIVHRPTLGLIGEGRFSEAVVPLPDGNRIPVDLRGAGGGAMTLNVFISAIDSQSVDAFVRRGDFSRALVSQLQSLRGTRAGMARGF